MPVISARHVRSGRKEYDCGVCWMVILKGASHYSAYGSAEDSDPKWTLRMHEECTTSEVKAMAHPSTIQGAPSSEGAKS